MVVILGLNDKEKYNNSINYMTRDFNRAKIEAALSSLSSGVFAGFGRIIAFIDSAGHHTLTDF